MKLEFGRGNKRGEITSQEFCNQRQKILHEIGLDVLFFVKSLPLTQTFCIAHLGLRQPISSHALSGPHGISPPFTGSLLTSSFSLHKFIFCHHLTTYLSFACCMLLLNGHVMVEKNLHIIGCFFRGNFIWHLRLYSITITHCYIIIQSQSHIVHILYF